MINQCQIRNQEKMNQRLNECRRIIKRDSIIWLISLFLGVGYLIYQIHSIGA